MPADPVVDGDLRNRLGDELADVLLYLVRLADVAGVDLVAGGAGEAGAQRGALPGRDLADSRA